MIVKARYVIPVDAPLIENGAVTIENGLITALGKARSASGPDTIDFGDAVICPGFVNAHTHLELSHLRGQVPPSSNFIDWLTRLIGMLNDNPPTREAAHESIRVGVDESITHGVTTLGDITVNPAWTRAALAQSAMRTVSFGEVTAIGRRRHLLKKRLDAACSTEFATERLQIGISPHAPYTVEPRAMKTCADRAAADHLPTCIHLLETPAEARFTTFREGPLADYLKDLNVWDDDIPTAACNPIELVQRAGLLTPRTLLAHANYATSDDIAIILEAGASVAYCPRTHHAFGHRPHPCVDMLRGGINVCIGTDSLASNPSLSILDELRFLRRARPEIPPAELIKMGTLHGAAALGFANVTGSLTVGKAADLAVMPLEPGTPDEGWTAILESNLPPTAVYVAGRHLAGASRGQNGIPTCRESAR